MAMNRAYRFENVNEQALICSQVSLSSLTLTPMFAFHFKHIAVSLLAMVMMSMPLAGKDATTPDSEPRVQVQGTDNPRAYRLVYQAAELQPFTLKVFNEAGDRLLVQKFYDEVNVAKLISFNQVPAGTYRIEVTGADFRYEEEIEVADERAQTLDVAVTNYRDGRRALLTVPGADKVFVEVYNQAYDTLYEGWVELDSDSFSKVFDLTLIPEGKLFFRVSYGEASNTVSHQLR